MEVIRNDTLQWGMYKSLLVFHCNMSVILYLVPFLRHPASNNEVTLKSGLWSYKVIKMASFNGSHTSSYWHFIVTIALYHFGDKARYWWKIAIFFHVPPAPRQHIAARFGMESRMVCVATRCWKMFDDMFSRFDTIPACVGHMQRQTDGHLATA